MQHKITYEILHFFFYFPIKTLAMEVELNQQTNKEKKREREKKSNGRHEGKKGGKQVGKKKVLGLEE